ncbi:MAG: Trm112 family protein [Myxococcota bacterium]|jgi:uncharacterized protein YbaR (Trm112 family)|nr:Trm112 family protein [Myxococcota bacterium]MDP7298510.1 Trm112 family protein [Myxococcota bacterium]MDP7432921.1 Trm112 family protein [Myxococcota bacterium]HJO25081.1 Trm112 family protein [Myxococcota bacterium]
MDEWLLRNLVCPIDRTPLTREQDTLWCELRHAYPIPELRLPVREGQRLLDIG